MPAPAVLLVGPDAASWASAPALRDATVTAVATVDDARAYLAGTAFDAVYIQEGVSGGAGLATLCAARSTSVDSVRSADDIGGPAETGPDPLAALAEELSRVAHSLNNPLAVIAGNVQLGLELARATGTDPDVMESLENIAQAATDLEGRFAEIAALRSQVENLRSGGSRG